MQHLITLRLITGVISTLMLAATVGVSWVRTEQAVHSSKTGHPAKHSPARPPGGPSNPQKPHQRHRADSEQ